MLRLQGGISFLLLLSSSVLPVVAATNPSVTQETKDSFRRPSSIPFPPSNPFSEAKYQLGKTLFFDTRLSGSQTLSCASCHSPSADWTTPKAPISLLRKVPTLLNTAWGWSFFWDGRADSLEEQALLPVQNKLEMNLSVPELITRLKKVAGYQKLFAAAFKDGMISPANVSRALATFERTLVSDLAPIDLYLAGNDRAISAEAARGFVLFNEKAACVKCHTGWNFTNGSFADTGLDSADEGKGNVTLNPDHKFAFKTPTLRNVARRGPFMHDGSLARLEDVIENYDQGGTVKRRTAHWFVKPLNLSNTEKKELLAFLQTLTSHDEELTPPPLPKDNESAGDTWASKESVRSY